MISKVKTDPRVEEQQRKLKMDKELEEQKFMALITPKEDPVPQQSQLQKTPEKVSNNNAPIEEEDPFDTDNLLKSVSPKKQRSPDRGQRNAGLRAQLEQEETKDRSQINAFDDLIEDDYDEVPQQQ